MFPADQRFKAGDDVGLCGNNRLIGNPHLPIDQRITQVFLQHAAVFGSLQQVARIETETTAARSLGGIERKVGAADQILARLPVKGADRNADRRADDAAAAIDRIRL